MEAVDINSRDSAIICKVLQNYRVVSEGIVLQHDRALLQRALGSFETTLDVMNGKYSQYRHSSWWQLEYAGNLVGIGRVQAAHESYAQAEGTLLEAIETLTRSLLAYQTHHSMLVHARLLEAVHAIVVDVYLVAATQDSERAAGMRYRSKAWQVLHWFISMLRASGLGETGNVDLRANLSREGEAVSAEQLEATYRTLVSPAVLQHPLFSTSPSMHQWCALASAVYVHLQRPVWAVDIFRLGVQTARRPNVAEDDDVPSRHMDAMLHAYLRLALEVCSDRGVGAAEKATLLDDAEASMLSTPLRLDAAGLQLCGDWLLAKADTDELLALAVYAAGFETCVAAGGEAAASLVQKIDELATAEVMAEAELWRPPWIESPFYVGALLQRGVVRSEAAGLRVCGQTLRDVVEKARAVQQLQHEQRDAILAALGGQHHEEPPTPTPTPPPKLLQPQANPALMDVEVWPTRQSIASVSAACRVLVVLAVFVVVCGLSSWLLVSSDVSRQGDAMAANVTYQVTTVPAGTRTAAVFVDVPCISKSYDAAVSSVAIPSSLPSTAATIPGYIFATNEALKNAVDYWCADATLAEKRYGHISTWITSNVTSMRGLFKFKKHFNEDIGRWDVSRVVYMSHMFFGAEAFNQPIGGWDVSGVTDMSSMFFEANAFNQPIGLWNVSNVKIMFLMFCGSKAFNQAIGQWNTSSVTTMSYMFAAAESFNQPIGDWDVSKVANMDGMFYNAGAFNHPIGVWNVSKVTSMRLMFAGATSFNQPVGEWDVSNVTDLSALFARASSYNQSIKEWNVSHARKMKEMFKAASSFNHDISHWNVSNVSCDERSEIFLGSGYTHAEPKWKPC